MATHLIPDGWIDSLKLQTGPGMLWDIVVEGASIRQWERALEAIRAVTHDDSEIRLIEDTDAPLDLVFGDEAIDRRLVIRLGEGEAHCHFFSPDEIEFDVDPRSMTSKSEHALLTLMRTLGMSTNRLCRLTPENQPASSREVARVFMLGRGHRDRHPRHVVLVKGYRQVFIEHCGTESRLAKSSDTISARLDERLVG